jgi:hypothetical protein
MFAAAIDLEFEGQAVAFVECWKTGTLDSRNVNESVRLPVIALDEAEALHRVEELDGALRLFAGQLALGSALLPLDHYRLALDLKVGRRNPAAAIHQGKAERLPFREIGKACLLNRRDVNEDVLASIIANDETETLLRIEEFDDALGLADDLRGHSATATATATAAKSAAAAAAATTITSAETAAVAECARLTIASALLESAAIRVAVFTEKPVALVSAATATVALTSSIETHARSLFPVPLNRKDQRAGEHGATGLVRVFVAHHLQPYMKKNARSSDSMTSTLL